jgi:Mg2+-importing ATPase
MDAAVLSHVELERQLIWRERHRKIDEVPFDFARRRMSVIVEDSEHRHILICKGALESLVGLCTSAEIDDQPVPLTQEYFFRAQRLAQELSNNGFRVIALAYKKVSGDGRRDVYSVRDESDLVLMGLLAFLDPPKKTAAEALKKFDRHGVSVKVLTGDNDIVTASICRKVGLSVENVLLGSAIEEMSDTELAGAVEKTTVFARLSPAQKERIIRTLRKLGHVVGFMGDGINDAPALRAADVGISVDTAVDIAKESSDVILLETSLLVLEEGVMEGRKVFGNITKYIRMAASSSFGNMFSVVGASIFLPFLPMLPVQVLINNMLYDFSQSTIPTDNVDSEWVEKPRKWSISGIRNFILVLGPISSIFDYAIFFILLYVFNAWTDPDLFHTGWFVLSIFTQTLIIHVLRTRKVPFIQSRASWPLILASFLVVAIGASLPFSPFAEALGFVPLPLLYWAFLAGIMICYVLLTQRVKKWFFQRFVE